MNVENVPDDLQAVLDRHLPGYEVHTFRRLGEGLDNAAYEVNGELVVRQVKARNLHARGETPQREAEVLRVVAGFSSLPVPEVVFVDAEAGVLAYRRLPGAPLNRTPAVDPARVAPALGAFVSGLHGAPKATFETLVPRDVYPLADWLRDAERDYLEVVARIPPAQRHLVEHFLASTPPPEPCDLAFCHNDLGSEHVLVDVETVSITGIIDWSDAAITDPARDRALMLRDLGSEALELALARYEGRFDDADRARTVFYARCKLLEDIAYGLRTGARQYADAGLAHLDRTFTSP